MKNTFVLLACVLALFADCKKKDTNAGPDPGPVFLTYSSMDTIYNMLAVKSTFTTVNGTTGATFTGGSGTRYNIPPNCLQDVTGTSVTGNVTVETSEYLKKGDMIFSKVLPISNDSPLISGGEVYINATAGGQQIFLKPGCAVTASTTMDNDTATGMSFFMGQPATGPNSGQSKINWKAKDSVRYATVAYNGDTIITASDSFGWFNADRFLSNPNYQTFTVTIGTQSTTQVNAFSGVAVALYDNYKGIWSFTNYSSGMYSENHVPNIPVHFVVFGLINGHFYAGIAAAIPITGHNYIVTLKETDPTSFKGQLNNLTN